MSLSVTSFARFFLIPFSNYGIEQPTLYFRIYSGTLETNEEVPPKLNELYNDVCTIIVEYTVFLEMFTAFLNNVKEVSTGWKKYPIIEFSFDI